MKKLVLLLIGIGIASIAFAGCSNPFTPAGHEGYVYEKPWFLGKGGFKGTITGPGNYGLSVLRNKVINIDTRPNTYKESFKIMTKDDLNISFSFHSVIAVKKNRVKDIVEKYGGEKWYERFLQKPLRTYVREVVQPYTSKEIKENRSVVSDSVEEKLSGYVKDTPFQLISVVVGDINYPKVVSDAVEKKLAAQQLLEEKETQKAIMKKDAEIRIEEARGIAEAQKIINATLTPNYLQHEAIQAQLKMAESPNHTTVYIPVGTNGIPLIQTTNDSQ